MMTDNRNRYRILALVTYVAMGLVCATLRGENAPPPSEASANNADILVGEQMDLAEKAPDRDTRLVHLREALTIRPDHRDNLDIEFRIAVELSQRYDPKYPDQTPRRDEAIVVYEGLLTKYNHMDYYSSEPVDRSYDPQTMVPQAAVHLAWLYQGPHGDSAKARDCLIRAMDCLKQTYEKRIEDWSSAPPPPKPDPNSPFVGLLGMGKWEWRMAQWNERRQDAADGNVLGPLEMPVVKAAVRQYAYTYGRQKPYEVPAIMGEIVKLFPGTPMAKVAQEHTRRAMAMAEKDLNDELSMDLSDMPTVPELGAATEAPGPSSAPASAPVDASREMGDSDADAPDSGNGAWYYWLVEVLGGCAVLAGVVLYVRRRRS